MRWYKLAGFQTMPRLDPEQHPEREGLEGPFRMLSGRVVYYDAREGKYYDAGTDMYLSEEEVVEMSAPRPSHAEQKTI